MLREDGLLVDAGFPTMFAWSKQEPKTSSLSLSLFAVTAMAYMWPGFQVAASATCKLTCRGTFESTHIRSGKFCNLEYL